VNGLLAVPGSEFHTVGMESVPVEGSHGRLSPAFDLSGVGEVKDDPHTGD